MKENNSIAPKYIHLFNLTQQDEIDLLTARTRYKAIDILRLGIKAALESMPDAPAAEVEKAKKIVK